MSSGNPPGLGGFGGDVGESQECYESLGFALKRLSEIRDNVETDSLNIESYVKELATMMIKITKSMGRMFEQEQLRFIAIFWRRGALEEAEEIPCRVVSTPLPVWSNSERRLGTIVS